VIQALRRRLSYANVMATIAVFIALGGSAYAALSITGRDVVNGSLTNRDLKANTIGGSRINESRLDRVKRARNADRLNGVTAARLFVRCRQGTVPVSDVCIETSARGAAPYSTAAVICEGTDRRTGPGRRLPNHDELMTAIGDYDIALAPGGELTRNVYPSATRAGSVDVSSSRTTSGALHSPPTPTLAPRPFAASPTPSTSTSHG
jgi:hypothetical protein